MSIAADAQIAVVKMRTYLRTLERYRSTSVGIHSRVVPAFYELGGKFITEVGDLERRFSDDPEVVRWAAKFHAYADQHKISVKKLTEDKK